MLHDLLYFVMDASSASKLSSQSKLVANGEKVLRKMYVITEGVEQLLRTL